MARGENVAVRGEGELPDFFRSAFAFPPGLIQALIRSLCPFDVLLMMHRLCRFCVFARPHYLRKGAHNACVLQALPSMGNDDAGRS